MSLTNEERKEVRNIVWNNLLLACWLTAAIAGAFLAVLHWGYPV